jgi:phosphoribosylformylglycinamidine synthase I
MVHGPWAMDWPGLRMKFGVVVFPGSNCDHDCYHVLKHVLGQETEFVWHKESDVSKFDCVVLPGGFSYGDYLRTGAIARFSPVMDGVLKHAEKGKLLIGICNGFQILTEAGLLPGVLMRNESLKFICRFVTMRVEATDSPFTRKSKKGEVLNIPIAHGEGNYFADAPTLERLKKKDQILLKYTDNPNGSLENIAGICNEKRNVFGLMPHPERASEKELGSVDGLRIFKSILDMN